MVEIVAAVAGGAMDEVEVGGGKEDDGVFGD